MASQNDSEDLGAASSPSGGLVQVGQTIRTQRQSLGLSPEQLAATMHMGVEQLTALELGQDDRLPEPVFIKAMVRRLASHLRLDADELVQQLGPTASSSPSIKALSVAAPWAAAATRSRPRRSLGWLVPVLLLAGAGAGYTLWQSSFSDASQPRPQTDSPREDPAEQEPAEPLEPVAVVPVKAEPSGPTQPIVVEISSSEPSWIALRRGGTIEFQGTLDEPRSINEPENVEIYAGRPDLVLISLPDQEPRSIGKISDVRWQKLIPER